MVSLACDDWIILACLSDGLAKVYNIDRERNSAKLTIKYLNQAVSLQVLVGLLMEVMRPVGCHASKVNRGNVLWILKESKEFIDYSDQLNSSLRRKKYAG